ncbi:hypothetical protein FB45DRAFT_758687 [Roridomyces roridus]|uniref:intramembrane prenyl-peptidase Rce1 n=1 Tax=Roridomyces roridus TaxID=1738132 RepID=A0AAD7FDQ0_9AGAR|nr:hypothetical protein FB45DRAFT_758687 [Roridomyces roridus]
MASAHPPLSMHTAHLLALGFSITYVGSLYVAKNARIRVNAYDARLKFQPGGRDDPAVIRARLMAVTIACVLSCGVVYYLLLGIQIQDPMVTTMRLLGVQWPPSVLSCLQTPLLFIGPIYGHYLASALPGQKHYSFKYHFVDTFFSWVGFRNYLWAPLTEEITFRACVLSVYAMGGASRWKMIAFAPLVFGLAHVHHGWEVYKQLGSTPAAFNRALVSAVFQTAYTTLFGAYASFLFLRTYSSCGLQRKAILLIPAYSIYWRSVRIDGKPPISSVP